MHTVFVIFSTFDLYSVANSFVKYYACLHVYFLLSLVVMFLEKKSKISKKQLPCC